MADCIIAGSGGGGVSSDELTARAAHVLAGKKFVGEDTDDDVGVGVMPNNGQVSRTLRAGENLQIARGYHDGTGVVNAVPLADQTAGNAGTGDILSGKTAWVNGRRVDGSVPVVVTDAEGARGNLTEWYGIDFNAHTLWMEIPHRSAYYTRADNKPHVCMDYNALGDAVAQQVLQGCTFTSKNGLKIPGAMYRWPLSGDIGGQKVMDAYENTVFAGDYGARGRGVFMRMPGGSQIDPTCMWAWAPAPTILPQNIRSGTNVLGVWGSMPDYSSTCVPFDGAHFDGTHISGWASGSFRYPTTQTWKPLQVGDFGDTGISSQRPSSYSLTWAFTPTVHLGAFKRVRITAFIDIRNCKFVYQGGSRGYAAMTVSFMKIVGGNQGMRIIQGAAGTMTGGLQQHDAGVYQFDIPVETFNEPVVIMVDATISQVQRISQKDALVRAGVSRVELIA